MENAMPIEDRLKPLEVTHDRAMQILDIRDSAYWKLVRLGRITTVGWGRGSRADYASLEAYHHARLTEPKKTLAMTLAMTKRRQATAAASAAETANRDIAAE
jgi:hypothetical protein